MEPHTFTVSVSQPLFTAACLLSCAVWVAVAGYKLFHVEAVVSKMREHHIPLARFAFWLSVIAEFLGALLIGSQRYVTAGALLWLLFLVLATPVYHGRVIRAGAIDYAQFVQVFKNISIAGGLCALIAIDLGQRAATAANLSSARPAVLSAGAIHTAD